VEIVDELTFRLPGLIAVVVLAVVFVFPIVSLVDIATSSQNHWDDAEHNRWLWVAIVCLTGPLGAAAYWLTVRRKRNGPVLIGSTD